MADGMTGASADICGLAHRLRGWAQLVGSLLAYSAFRRKDALIDCLLEAAEQLENEIGAEPANGAAPLAELARLRARVAALLDQNQAIAENVARMLPVYSAAVAWRRADSVSRGFGGKAELSALADAVDKLFETKGET